MKQCTKCKETKSLEEFSWKNKKENKKASECKFCHRKQRRSFYLRNKSREIQRAKDQKSKIIFWFKKLKSSFKCSKCGEDHPTTLEFHHLDPNTKKAEVSKLVSEGHKKQTIEEEINKCIVLCANCHRKLHAAMI